MDNLNISFAPDKSAEDKGRINAVEDYLSLLTERIKFCFNGIDENIAPVSYTHLDIAIRNADILNLFWEPGIKDIEESANLFYVTLVDRERLNLMYPELCEDDTESVAGGTENVEKYKTEDKTDDSAKVEVVDWYYKKTINGRKQLCYCKFCGDRVIYSSEDDESLSLIHI